MLSDALPATIDKFPQESGGLLSFFAKEEVGSIIKAAITPDQLQQETEKTIDAIYSYNSLQSDSINLTYELSLYKKNLAKAIEKAFVNKLDKLPKCSQNQLQDLYSRDNFEKLPSCIPTGISSEQALKEFKFDQKISSEIANLPDKIIITEKQISSSPKNTNLFKSGHSPFAGLTKVRENLSRFLGLVYPSTATTIIFLLIIVFLRLPSWRSVFTWVGISLIISGITVSLIALVLKLLPYLAGEPILNPFGLGSEGIRLIKNILVALSAGFTNQIFIISVPSLTIGVILIAVTLIARNKSEVGAQNKIS